MRNHSYENEFDLHENETACRIGNGLLDSNRVKIVVNAFHCKLFSSIGCVSLTYLPATCAGVLEIQLLLLQYGRHLNFIELVF